MGHVVSLCFPAYRPQGDWILQITSWSKQWRSGWSGLASVNLNACRLVFFTTVIHMPITSMSWQREEKLSDCQDFHHSGLERNTWYPPSHLLLARGGKSASKRVETSQCCKGTCKGQGEGGRGHKEILVFGQHWFFS